MKLLLTLLFQAFFVQLLMSASRPNIILVFIDDMGWGTSRASETSQPKLLT